MQTALAGEARRRREEALDDPWRLDAKTATEEAFNDEYATGRDVPAHERGPHSRWAQGLLDTKCCGWRERPTAAETYAAFRADEPTTRETAILATVVGEGTALDWGMMYHERGVHMAPDETGGTENRTVDRAHGNQAESVHGGRQGDGRAPVARLAEPARTLWRQVRDTIRTALTDPRTNDRCYELG